MALSKRELREIQAEWANEGLEIPPFVWETHIKALSRRRFLENNEEPTLNFVVEFYNGLRGHADNPLYLMDLIFDRDFSDEEFETMAILGLVKLKDLAIHHFGFRSKRVLIVDPLGPFMDNSIALIRENVGRENELRFENKDKPIVIDAWDCWTIVSDLVRAGYIKIYEKIPVWSDKNKKQSCQGCVFKKENKCSIWLVDPKNYEHICQFPTFGGHYEGYHEVQADEMINPRYKHAYVPVDKRTEEFIGFRYREPSDD